MVGSPPLDQVHHSNYKSTISCCVRRGPWVHHTLHVGHTAGDMLKAGQVKQCCVGVRWRLQPWHSYTRLQLLAVHHSCHNIRHPHADFVLLCAPHAHEHAQSTYQGSRVHADNPMRKGVWSCKRSYPSKSAPLIFEYHTRLGSLSIELCKQCAAALPHRVTMFGVMPKKLSASQPEGLVVAAAHLALWEYVLGCLSPLTPIVILFSFARHHNHAQLVRQTQERADALAASDQASGRARVGQLAAIQTQRPVTPLDADRGLFGASRRGSGNPTDRPVSAFP
jgi:hypothetical protein